MCTPPIPIKDNYIAEFFREPEEIVVGIAFTCCWVPFLGWWTVVFAPIVGLLWKLGGWEHGNRYFRRIGVPVVMMAAFWLSLGDPILSTSLLYGALCLGYGVPDYITGDKGSAIGSFVYKLIPDEIPYPIAERIASVITRFIVGSIIGLSMIGLAAYWDVRWLIGAVSFAFVFPLIERIVE